MFFLWLVQDYKRPDFLSVIGTDRSYLVSSSFWQKLRRNFQQNITSDWRDTGYIVFEGLSERTFRIMAGSGGPVATFSVWDYVVFAGLILFAAGIGLFQAIRGRKETSSDEFLLGGRQMSAVPVALSLTASFMSGITVIGTPAEAYMYGTPFWLFIFSYTIMSIISAELFVPLFYRLSITSTYEVRGQHWAQGVCMRTENRDRKHCLCLGLLKNQLMEIEQGP